LMKEIVSSLSLLTLWNAALRRSKFLSDAS
jgi:hypothetical protein